MAWKCKQCDTIHGSNPSACRNCGHPIMTPASPSDLRKHADGVDSPEAMDPDEIKSPGSIEDPDFSEARSPDVAVDGSIGSEETEPIEREDEGTSGIVAWLRAAVSELF